MKILLAEDSSFYRRLIADHLKQWDFEFTCARTGNDAWRALTKKDAPRLALLDWVLPDIEGIELCRRLRSRAETEPYTYTVLLTAKSEKEEMLRGMDAGADDFLAKPFDPHELKARLLVGKRILELQEKLVSTNSALHFAATHDFLTRIWNRAEILAFLKRELARARRDSTTVGLILVDVDHFKRVNDDFGHQAGDLVLQEIAGRFSHCVREYDGIGRYGGEEFLLILTGCDMAVTVRRANQIRTAISSEPVPWSQGSIPVSVSMGVSVAEPPEDIELLLRRTDAALYNAKKNGRNRVECSLIAAPSTGVGVV
jgi:two-component system, cell cycle response regulator